MAGRKVTSVKVATLMATKGSAAGATPGVDVYVKLPSGRTITFDMLPADSVQRIISRVAEEESVEKDLVSLKYTGKVLDKSKTIGYLGICAETILKAEIIRPRNFHLYIKLESGKTVPLELENLGSVGSIKDEIQVREEIEPSRQTLKLGDRVLSNMKARLVDAGVTDEAIIHLTVTAAVTETKSTKKKLKTRKGSIGSGSGSDPEGTDTDGETEAPERPAATNKVPSPGLGEEEKEAVINSFNATGRNVEIVFSFDTTGSMYSCLTKVRSKLEETIKRLLQHIPNIRIGIIAHGDYCDYSNYVLRMVDLTNDVEDLVKFVNGVPSTGGGDAPECYEWVLRKAPGMDWSEDSAKALVVIGDQIPHPPSYTDQKVNWHEQLDILSGMEVKVYGVKALSSLEALPFYQELADKTGGAFITFQNFDIISEMFMAVCYREASDEQFEAYCQEVAQSEPNQDDSAAATKVKDIQKVLTQLDEQKKKKDAAQPEPTRYVAAAWWDLNLDRERDPLYCYNQDTDKWSKHLSPSSNSFSPPERSASFHGSRPKTAKSKKRFSFRSRSSRYAASDALETSPGSDRKSKSESGRRCVIM